MKNDQSLLLGIGFVVITAIAILIYSCTCESFTVSAAKKPSFYHEYNSDKTSENIRLVKYLNASLSSGSVSKFKMSTGMFEYSYVFNLPLTHGGDYVVGKPNKYNVYAGKNKETVSFIGELIRGSDGIYRLYIISPNDYVYTEIHINKTPIMNSDLV